MKQPVRRSRNTTGDWGVADYLIASKSCDIAGLEQLRRTGRLVVCISNLVHALQRERGVSNLHVGSGGRRPTAALDARIADTRAMDDRFRAALRGLTADITGSPAGSHLCSRIAYALQRLAELDAMREGTRAVNLTPEAIIDGYSELIHCLLAVVFEAADSAVDPDISRALVAMFQLMQGKEFAGRERAVGAAGFARGGFDARLVERLRNLIDSQERCFQVLVHFADADSLLLWRERGCGECSAEMERLRRVALTSAAGTRIDTDLSDLWFERTTQRIDAMKQVEDRLEANLDALCERKLAEARADMESHRHRIDALARLPSGRAPLTVFSSAGADAAEAGSFIADPAGSRLGRSLVELVQSQALRLQAMSEELDEARAALAERKTIDRAKALLIKHRGISEEEAYCLLRTVAMAQNRRLADVARDTIAMAGLLGPMQ